MSALLLLTLLILGFILNSFCLQSYNMSDVQFVLANSASESHIDACYRSGLKPTDYAIKIDGYTWNSSLATSVVDSLFANGSFNLISCCVPGLWCNSSSSSCYTNGYSPYFVNYGNNRFQEDDYPVYSCVAGSSSPNPFFMTSADPVSPSIENVFEPLATGSNDFEYDEFGMYVNVEGGVCTDVEMCWPVCKGCNSDGSCGADQVCVGPNPSSGYCYTYCDLGDDEACPCGYYCNTLIYPETFGEYQVPLCMPLTNSHSCSGNTDAKARCSAHDLLQSSPITLNSSVFPYLDNHPVVEGDAYSSSLGMDVFVKESEEKGSVDSILYNSDDLPYSCSSHSDCEDGNLCTLDYCMSSPQQCVHAYRNNTLCMTQLASLRERKDSITYVPILTKPSSYATIQNTFTDTSSITNRDDWPMDIVTLPFTFSYFNHHATSVALNPNGLVQFPPHSPCSANYLGKDCPMVSSERNTITVVALDWYPGVFFDSMVMVESDTEVWSIMWKDVYLWHQSSDYSNDENSTFSLSLYSDGL